MLCSESKSRARVQSLSEEGEGGAATTRLGHRMSRLLHVPSQFDAVARAPPLPSLRGDGRRLKIKLTCGAHVSESRARVAAWVNRSFLMLS